MIEFVYNRTINHVNRLARLQEKGYENLSDSEKAEYRGYASLGAYNCTDLNRVEGAVKELAATLGIIVNTKTDWAYHDVFTRTYGDNVYIGNVAKVRNAALALDPSLTFPALPDTMRNFTYEGANAIEKNLSIIYERFCVDAPGYGTAEDPYIYASVYDFTKAWAHRVMAAGEITYIQAPLGGETLIFNSAPEGAAVMLNDKDVAIAYPGDSYTFEGNGENIVIGIRNQNELAHEIVTLTAS